MKTIIGIAITTYPIIWMLAVMMAVIWHSQLLFWIATGILILIILFVVIRQFVDDEDGDYPAI